MNELISVILPVYNGGKYLNDAIESILSQTYENFEFIIINDGSKDNSLDIIKEYEKKDSRIIIISRENKGLIATLNEGIQMAKGKYIARMDQDDISLPARFKNQIEFMKKKDLDICGGNYIIIDENNKILINCEVPQNSDEILLTLASNVPFAHPSVIIKKEFLIKNDLIYGLNGYRNAEDLDLWINMYLKGAKFGNINEKTIKYRILSHSMSRANHKKIKIESNNAFDDFLIKNKCEYENVFKNIIKNNLTNGMQQNLIKASWRFFFIYKNYKILFESFKGIKFYNLIRATLSFFKYKVF
jgi:glycosyltransferase involved in cell wall biosynthesis